MASPCGGPAANLLVLLKVILLATLVVSAVAVGNVPGLKWSALEVWEGSASGDAWTRSLEYRGGPVIRKQENKYRLYLFPYSNSI